MLPLILRVNMGGQPMAWLPWQEAVLYYAKDQVAWTLGEQAVRIFGGINNRTKKRSFLDLHPIVAVKGKVDGRQMRSIPPLTNQALFRRDEHTCMYCLQSYTRGQLTRDHVVPISRGGQDEWCNVVTACAHCNQSKDNRLLHETSMKLHALPYAPNFAEWLILRNRNILADQMDFLKAQCPKRRQ